MAQTAMRSLASLVLATSVLIVLVTATLVEPGGIDPNMPVPGDLWEEPTDWQFYIDGRLDARMPAGVAPADAEWLKQRGFDRLEGPGAWATYEQGPAASEVTAEPEEDLTTYEEHRLEDEDE